MQIDTRGSRSGRKPAKGKSVVMAAMIGAAVGAVVCGGGIVVNADPGTLARAPIVWAIAVVAALIGGAVCAFIAAGVTYVSH